MMSKRKRRDRIVRIIDTLVYLYLMYACLWAICHLVGEILGKMGVG